MSFIDFNPLADGNNYCVDGGASTARSNMQQDNGFFDNISN